MILKTQTSTNECTDDVNCSLHMPHTITKESERRDIYMPAQALKLGISNASEIKEWPPTETDIDDDVVEKIVLKMLFKFLAWCTGHSLTH